MDMPRPSLGLIAGSVLLAACAAVPTSSPEGPSAATPAATPAPTPARPSPSPAATSAGASPSVRANSGPIEGEWLVFQTDIGAGNAIWLMRPDGQDAHPIAESVMGDQLHPDWSPDGMRIVFIADGDIWTVSADGTGAQQVLECGGMCDYPAWSPNGSSLAFTRYVEGPNAPGASSIEELDLTSKATRVVTSATRPNLVDVARWSPDGKRLVVGIDLMNDAGDDTGSSIGIVDAAGGERRDLLPFDTFAYYPDWNRATGEIVYSIEMAGILGDDGPNWDLFGIQPDGTGRHKITDVGPDQQVFQPSWTPDGTTIIASRVGDRAGLWIDPGSGKISAVVNLDWPITHPRSRPAS
jgi:Tol biopolymer transport system component